MQTATLFLKLDGVLQDTAACGSEVPCTTALSYPAAPQWGSSDGAAKARLGSSPVF